MRRHGLAQRVAARSGLVQGSSPGVDFGGVVNAIQLQVLSLGLWAWCGMWTATHMWQIGGSRVGAGDPLARSLNIQFDDFVLCLGHGMSPTRPWIHGCACWRWALVCSVCDVLAAAAFCRRRFNGVRSGPVGAGMTISGVCLVCPRAGWVGSMGSGVLCYAGHSRQSAAGANACSRPSGPRL